MKHLLHTAAALFILMLAASCYEDYLNDYEEPSMGFPYPRQVRTLVSNNNIAYVGVSIGGKRQLTLNEWASFAIDESLLSGSKYTLLPGEYYTLSDPNMMRARRKKIFTADVAVEFNDKFFDDPKSVSNTYALPLRIMKCSFPDIPDSTGVASPNGAILERGETAVIVFKYISEFSGTYYGVGTEVEVDEFGSVIGEEKKYDDKDLTKNPTFDFITNAKNEVTRPGLGTTTKGGVRITVSPVDGVGSYSLQARALTTGGSLESFSGRYVPEGDYTFFSGDEKAPQFELEYTYKVSGKFYKVSEKLVLRQWPSKDLRLETF